MVNELRQVIRLSVRVLNIANQVDGTMAVKTLICGEEMWGTPLIVTLVCLIGGIQLFCMGVMGQYLAKTYMEVKDRPKYIIGETEQGTPRRNKP